MLSKQIRAYWLPILSGIFIGTSYIPFPPWALAFALVPLWSFWLRESSWQRIWWSGWITQYVLTLIGFNWVAHTLHEFGPLPWPVAILGLVLYCGFASLHVPLAGLLWFFLNRRLKGKAMASILLLPATFIFTEMTYPMIFDWHLGYPLMPTGWPGIHLAEWIGFRGLSALVVLVNAVFLWMFLERKRKSTALAGAVLLATLALVTTALGLWLRERQSPADASASVLIVQANIGNLEKIEQEKSDDARGTVLTRYLTQTESAIGKSRPDFVVWPETAYPHLLNEPYLHSTAYAHRLRTFIQQHGLTLLTGGYGWIDGPTQLTNSFFMLNPEGSLADEPYSKTRLLAFGEYLPGADWFPVLRRWLPQVGQFARGTGVKVGTAGGIRFGPLICYEGLFDEFGRDLARQGAQVIVNVTNDSWYGTWQQPYQHLYMTLARAIEIRRPVIRSTNTGISTIALGTGEILAQSPLHREWQHLYELKYLKDPPRTGFMGWGFYFSWGLIALLALAAWWSRGIEGT